MTHSVNLDENGIMIVKLVGVLGDTDVAILGAQAAEIAYAVVEKGGIPLILADLSDEVGADVQALRLAMHIMPVIDNEKVAVFGANERVMEEVKSIAKAGNDLDSYRFFDSREAAYEWLLQEKKAL